MGREREKEKVGRWKIGTKRSQQKGGWNREGVRERNEPGKREEQGSKEKEVGETKERRNRETMAEILGAGRKTKRGWGEKQGVQEEQEDRD